MQLNNGHIFLQFVPTMASQFRSVINKKKLAGTSKKCPAKAAVFPPAIIGITTVG